MSRKTRGPVPVLSHIYGIFIAGPLFFGKVWF